MSDEQLIDLLTAGTVRIDIGDETSGTGFFVTTGHVLTCTHVVEAAILTASTNWSDVKIIDSTGAVHTPTADSTVDRDSDLAMLRLKHASADVTPVLLDEAVEVDDELFAYGFPSSAPKGTPGTYVTEGMQGGPPLLIKFKEGEVRPGMSGSPLLNRRTGRVCGVLRKTRDEESDLGGYGIPLSVMSGIRGLEELSARNGQVHQAGSRWREAMSSDQRSMLGVPRRPAGETAYDLVIEVGQQADNWCVSAVVPPTGEHLPSEAVDLNAVRTEVARLFRLWKAHERLGDSEQAKLLGSVLAKALLPGAIGERFESLVSGSLDIDVALHFQEGIDNDLIHLPWEQLYVAERPGERRATPIGAARRLTLTRVAAVEPSRPETPVRDSFTVLVIEAPSATGVAVAERAKEVSTVAADLSGVTATDGGRPSDDSLPELLGKTSPDVLHYVGYGRFFNSEDQIALKDEDSSTASYLDPDEFADALAENSPMVVVLQPCEQPTGTVPADFAVFAPQLLLVPGVKAVVAFQLPLVAEDEPERFLEPFYRVLAGGGSVRHAVQEGRIRVRRRRPWAMPAVFMRNPSDLRLVASRRATGTGQRGTWGGTSA